MKPINSCLPVWSLTHLYTCPTLPNMNVACFLVGLATLLLHTGGTYKTQLSSDTLYVLHASHMEYFIILLIHQNFNPCINPTSLMDMPIPIDTFHSMSLITKTYATCKHKEN